MTEIIYEGFKIVPSPFNSFQVKPNGKGSVATTLRGAYTSVNIAKQAIDSYINVKELENGKKSAGSKA